MQSFLKVTLIVILPFLSSLAMAQETEGQLLPRNMNLVVDIPGATLESGDNIKLKFRMKKDGTITNKRLSVPEESQLAAITGFGKQYRSSCEWINGSLWCCADNRCYCAKSCNSGGGDTQGDTYSVVDIVPNFEKADGIQFDLKLTTTFNGKSTEQILPSYLDENILSMPEIAQ